MQGKPDSDWQEKVRLAKASPPEESFDTIFGWRMKQLVFAGAPFDLAEKLANEAGIDLHRAVNLIKDAGPSLTEEILL